MYSAFKTKAHRLFFHYSSSSLLTVQSCPTPTDSGWNLVKHLLFNTQQRAAGSAASTNILEEETWGLVKYTSSLTSLTPKSVAGGQFQVQATQVNSWLLGIYWKAPSALKRWIKTHNCCLEGNWSLAFKSPCMWQTGLFQQICTAPLPEGAYPSLPHWWSWAWSWSHDLLG